MTDAANQPVWQWGYSAFGDNEPSIAARNFRDRSWRFAKGELSDLADGSDDVDNNAQFGKQMVKLNLRYPGQYFDDESNLHYNGFRSYSPLGGRYTQVDPIGLNGGWNPVVYAESSPLNFIDPEGLSSLPKGSPKRPIELMPLDGGGGGGGGTLSTWAARRETMRQAGIPTSQQPSSQSRNASGREYSYDVPAPGGGSKKMSAQQQTLDRSHPGQSHWEIGSVKIDPLTGLPRFNQYGCPRLTNDKIKFDY